MHIPPLRPRRSGIRRVPLRDQVHHAIVDRILRDDLRAGSRISDTVLARELGVSRTPIREALLRLEREGFLRSELGRGFFIKPLSSREVAESYPVLWTLEALALREAGAPAPPRLAEMEAVNARLEEETDPASRIDLDGEWHRLLLEPCGNRLLLETIASLKQVIRRYEYAYMQNAGHVPLSTRTHEQIAERMAAGDVEGAVPLLEGNWRATRDTLVAWLREVV